MALAELRGWLGRSFEKIRETSNIDEMRLKRCLNEITCALFDADFHRLLVNEIERKGQEIINLPMTPRNGKLIYQMILVELSSKIDLGKSTLIQEKRVHSIVMIIGLRGVDKTNTCAKYARYHRKKGFRPALVCADTFKIDAFARLKKTTKDEVPVYGSNTSDPAQLAAQEIEKFKKEKRTSGRHKQYSALFEEMRQLAGSMNPDLVVYVMDKSIGKTAFDQAQAFSQSFTLGVVIVANINGNSKAYAKCPMILAETGEQTEEFEAFEAEPFFERLLPNPWDKSREYTLRKMYTYNRRELGLEAILPLVLSHCKKLNYEKIRRHTTIMDSVTDGELDKSYVKQMSKEKMMEIAKASKVNMEEVVDMMKAYKIRVKWFMECEEDRICRHSG